jgi:hypothetical protein
MSLEHRVDVMGVVAAYAHIDDPHAGAFGQPREGRQRAGTAELM